MSSMNDGIPLTRLRVPSTPRLLFGLNWSHSENVEKLSGSSAPNLKTRTTRCTRKMCVSCMCVSVCTGRLFVRTIN